MKTTFPLRRFLWISLTAAVYVSAAHGSEVRGRISGDAGKPVAHAVVRLLPEAPGAPKAVRVETGDDGTFVATGLTAERFTVRVESKGYAPLTQREIPAGATVQLRLPKGVKLTGVLSRRIEGTPVEGATVLAWEKAAEPFGEAAYRSAKSGKDGRFTIADLPEGKVAVEAKATGFAPAKSAGVAVPKTEFSLQLDPAGGLTGLVTDTKGEPVAGAEVLAASRAETGVKRKTAKTGPDGRYRIPDAGSESVSAMTVRAQKFLDATRDGPAPADGVVDFVLEHGGSIAGTVRGYDGKVPASFKVAVRAARKGEPAGKPEVEFTDPTGAFRVDDLDPGTYAVEVGAERYASVDKAEVEVSAEQVTDLGSLTLLSRSMLRGRAVAARDRVPVESATVRVELVAGGDTTALSAATSWTATTGADGTFTTPALPAGTFDLTIEHPQFAPGHTRVTFQPEADTPEVLVEMFRGGVLTGSVVNGKLLPVPGVRIVATLGVDGESRIADTASDGQYFMDGLSPGTWTVTRQQAPQPGSKSTDTKLAAIREGETTTVDFDEKPRVSVSGVVIKGDTPVPNATIYFVALNSSLPRDGTSATADADGRFQVGLLHGGRYQVSVVFASTSNANGHSVVTLNIPDQPEVQQDIVFSTQAIGGHVVDEGRKGVKGALVTAVRQGTVPGDAPRQATTMTVDDGTFRIEALDQGSYRVTARAKAFGSAEEFPVVVSDDQPEPDLVLTLQRGWIMRGRLVDPQGRGVGGALVVVAPNGASESGYLPSQTDANGVFRITAPTDGPINVGAISARFAPAVQTDVQQGADDDSPDVELHATPGGTLRVRVVHRGGEPVAGVQLAFQPVPLFPGSDVVVDRNRPRPTEADGTTVLTLVYPSTYVISIPGRRDVAPVQVFVSEGTQTDAVVEVP